MVVTLEPCAMCAGALVQARVTNLVYGPDDPKAGAVASLFDLVRDPRLPHRLEVRGGVLAPEGAALLRSFFATRRYTPGRQGARVDEWGGLENR
jgi:tRNA(adenine34) deaminase